MSESSDSIEKDKVYKAYSLLDVIPGDSAAQIRSSYRKQVAMFHPDKFSSNPGDQAQATEKMKAINEAYTLIRHAPLSHRDRSPASNFPGNDPKPKGKNIFKMTFLRYNPGKSNKRGGGLFFTCFFTGCGFGVLFGILFSFAILMPLNFVYNYLTTGTANLTVLPVNVIVILISTLFFGLYNGIAKTVFAFLDSR
jgi:hypothetical protein